jgi:hypothetical protein
MGALSPIWGRFRGAASALASACGRWGWVRDVVAPVWQPGTGAASPSGCTGMHNPPKQAAPAPAWRVVSAQDPQPATDRGRRPRPAVFRWAIEAALQQAQGQLGGRQGAQPRRARPGWRRSMHPRSERGSDAFVLLRRNPPKRRTHRPVPTLAMPAAPDPPAPPTPPLTSPRNAGGGVPRAETYAPPPGQRPPEPDGTPPPISAARPAARMRSPSPLRRPRDGTHRSRSPPSPRRPPAARSRGPAG